MTGLASIFGLLLALAALALLAVGLWGDRAKGRLRCPKCWYPLESTPPNAPCPECGHASPLARRSSSRRRLLPLLTSLPLAAAALFLLAGKDRLITWAYRLLPAWRTESRLAAGASGEFEVITLANRRPDWSGVPRCIEVLRSGQRIFRMEAFYPQVGTYQAPPTVQFPPGLGTTLDLTGDGAPDLWISDPSPGTGAIATQYLFRLDPSASTASITPQAIIPYVGWFVDENKDGLYEFHAVDRTFAYWWTPGFNSPYPTAILAWKEDHYEADGTLMRARTDGPDAAAIAAATLAATSNTEPDFGLWVGTPLQTALDLIYRGRAQEAFDFLRSIWPQRFNTQKSAAQAIQEITQHLKTSPFAHAILEANRGQLP